MSGKEQMLVDHYEQCLKLYGDTHRGVDWPDATDAALRYQVMLSLIKDKSHPASLLDLGCGAGALLTHIRDHNHEETLDYTGIDLGESFIQLCQEKFPQEKFYQRDVLKNGLESTYDYIVMNGLFTEKLTMSFDEMWFFFTSMIKTIAPNCSKGMAFNLMSKHVDWERDDLFHVPLDKLMEFVTQEVSRKVVIRNDYGLFEFTTYVYFD